MKRPEAQRPPAPRVAADGRETLGTYPHQGLWLERVERLKNTGDQGHERFEAVALGAGTTTAMGSVWRFCWNSMFWSAVSTAWNSAAACRRSVPLPKRVQPI